MNWSGPILRHLAPAMGFVGWRELLRGSFGVLLGLLALELIMQPITPDIKTGLFMIAPFAPTALLLFSIPNSPLAQPWSAIVGNCISAAVGVTMVLWLDEPISRAALASAGSLAAMALLRATHPPGAAVAIGIALTPEIAHDMGYLYVLAPVGLGTAMLVAFASVFGPITGRRYPFRVPPAPASEGKAEPPIPGIGLSHEDLARILRDFRQSTNIGTEDLARLIKAVENLQIQQRLADGSTTRAIMSKTLTTVLPDTPVAQLAKIFRQRDFTALPVADAAGTYLGMIFAIQLVQAGDLLAPPAPSNRLAGATQSAMARIGRIFQSPPAPQRDAQSVMKTGLPPISPDTPIEDLFPLLASGAHKALAVLEAGKIVGMVTRADLVTELARNQSLIAQNPTR